VVTPVKEAIRVCQEYANSTFSARVDPNLQVSGEVSQRAELVLVSTTEANTFSRDGINLAKSMSLL